MNRQTIFSADGIRRLARDEAGSAVLEASLVYPLLLASVLALLLASAAVYQQIGLYYASSVTADRAAFHWDNSYRHPVSGIVRPGERDGLYWRLSDDRMLEAVFGWAGGGASGTDLSVHIPDTASSDGPLAGRKMKAAAAWLPSYYSGHVTYSRNPLLRTVTARFKTTGGGTREAASTIVEPAEFIRTTDLFRYYRGKFGSGAGAAGKRKEAADTLRGLGSGA